MSNKKVLSVLKKVNLQEYDLNKPHLKQLTVSDLNNLSQAIMENARKGGTVHSGRSCCCTQMCCT